MAAAPGTANARFWGQPGHRIIGDVAAASLPEQMPKFFRDARAQLSYLNPDPDRWGDRGERALDSALNDAQSIEHYVDLELVPGNALNARSRYTFIDSLHAHGVGTTSPGFLPYRMLELTQSLRVQFRLWRAEKDSTVKQMIEQRIINDAGLLGHYVGDGSNPHHTTRNHDKWIETANPNGFTTVAGFHSRFESRYVESHMTASDIAPLVGRDARVIAPVRDGIWSYLRTSFSNLDRLYSLDKIEAFGLETKGAEHKQFTAERIAAGATMLRDLWWTAYVTSAPEIGKP
ncbi:MAG: nuclease [Gemmatimonadaceae bacterium]